MLRIAICDDEVLARDELTIKLEEYLREGAEEIIYDFSSGRSAVNWMKKHPGEVDLLFLDVEMEGMSGIETARRIREFDRNLMIVFVTGYADYVFEGYGVDALDYIIKPVDSERMRTVLCRVREKMYREEEQIFLVKNAEGTYRFFYKDILYFYSDKRKVSLVTKDREYSFYDRLDSVEKKISDELSFVRIHQRYLVNAVQVSYIGGHSVEIGEILLPISRAFREEAVKKLAQAMLRE